MRCATSVCTLCTVQSGSRRSMKQASHPAEQANDFVNVAHKQGAGI
ncbi:hypothetical protein X734_32905 [Mesorhizobium sp. L2C084A000]|nr:hypothetical protein X734_32905 [Mesorhizobium sp. L2C084A000]